MQTECSAERSMFGRVEGRSVVAEFDGGALTSDAGGLLLGAADQRLGLVRRIARCFRDARDPRLVEHSVATLIGQRVFGIALGYEDLNDHDELRHDPLMAVLAGKLEARREDCAPLAGKSTLNRHCQSKFYTACLRTWAGQSSTVFAHESRTRSARFDAGNGLYLFALTVPRDTSQEARY
jgi:hypothetical protein